LKDIKVYATPGNHDTYPLDSFKGNLAGETKLMAEWASDWDVFLENEE